MSAIKSTVTASDKNMKLQTDDISEVIRTTLPQLPQTHQRIATRFERMLDAVDSGTDNVGVIEGNTIDKICCRVRRSRRVVLCVCVCVCLLLRVCLSVGVCSRTCVRRSVRCGGAVNGGEGAGGGGGTEQRHLSTTIAADAAALLQPPSPQERLITAHHDHQPHDPRQALSDSAAALGSLASEACAYLQPDSPLLVPRQTAASATAREALIAEATVAANVQAEDDRVGEVRRGHARPVTAPALRSLLVVKGAVDVLRLIVRSLMRLNEGRGEHYCTS